MTGPKQTGALKEGGFTMIELMIAIGIMGIVIAGLYNLYQLGWQTYTLGATQIQLQQTARNAMDDIVSELRQAKYSTVVISNYLSTMPFSSISFTDRRSYTVGYGVVSANDNAVRSYASKGDTGYALVRYVVPYATNSSVSITASLLCRDVQCAMFTYSQGTDKYTVLASLTLTRNTWGRVKPRTVQLKESVQMMNP